MNYELMHKNIIVADVEIDEDDGAIKKKIKTHNALHAPLRTIIDNTFINQSFLKKWWLSRAIPASRQGLKEASFNVGNYELPRWLLLKGMGLSLSDHYWVRPKGSDVKWEKVNFFQNSFSEDVGRLLFGEVENLKDLNLHSPDNTAEGMLKKKWIISENKRVLVKGSYGSEQQEAVNEVIASCIMEKMGINHTKYDFFVNNETLEIYSTCENFITQNTELVTMYNCYDYHKKPNNISEYDNCINIMKDLGCENIQKKLEEMLCIDYIMGNTDRHYNNFGIIRNVETLDIIDFAPIYDTGTSLYANKSLLGIYKEQDIAAKPFRSTHNKQSELIKNTILDFSKLQGINEEIYKIMSKSPLLDEERKTKLIGVLNYRINNLEQILDKQVVKTYNTEQIVAPKTPANLPDVIVGYKIVETTSILEDKVYVALMTDLYGSANPYIVGKVVYKNGKYYAMNRQSFPDMDKARTAYEKLIETLQYEIEHPEEMQQQIAPVVNNLEHEDELEL